MSINYQEHWKNHEIVTDKMVMEFKEKAEIKPFESLMTVPEDNHFKAFKTSIPQGMVAWLIVDRRLPQTIGYFLNNNNILYSEPNGDNPVKRTKFLTYA
jgi:hypothetical protein